MHAVLRRELYQTVSPCDSGLGSPGAAAPPTEYLVQAGRCWPRVGLPGHALLGGSGWWRACEVRKLLRDGSRHGARLENGRVHVV